MLLPSLFPGLFHHHFHILPFLPTDIFLKETNFFRIIWPDDIFIAGVNNGAVWRLYSGILHSHCSDLHLEDTSKVHNKYQTISFDLLWRTE